MSAQNPQITTADRQVSLMILFVTFISLTVWSVYIESDGKYILYSLPVTIFLSHLMFRGSHIVIMRDGIVMMLSWLTIALTALAMAGGFDVFTLRDVLIISGCLSFFLFRHNAPAFVPPLALFILFVSMLIEFSGKSIPLNFDILSSTGLAETSLAFPIGLVVLYFYHERRWFLFLLSFALFFAAFKRVALAAVIVIMIIDIAMRLLGRRTIPKALAVTIVIACSIASLYTLELFEFAVSMIGDYEISQGSLSMGRSELARNLWHEMDHGRLLHRVFGHGPGAADVILIHTDGGPNPHNDWLKIFFDYGIAGFVAMHLILFLMHNRSGVAPMLYIYTAVVMMTDNVLLYMFHFIFVYLVVATAPETAAVPTAPHQPAADERPGPAGIMAGAAPSVSGRGDLLR